MSLPKLVFLLLMSLLQTGFIFTNDTEKITLNIDQGDSHLTWNKTSILRLEMENIDPQKMTISALGIERVNQPEIRNTLMLKVTPNQKNIKEAMLPLHVSYRNEKGKFVSHKFILPIN